MRFRISIAVALVAALALIAATHAASQTLELEDLTAPAATFTTTFSCNTAGISTVSWTASGLATGPYPGTFTASGTLTIGPQTLPGRPPGPGEGTFAGPIESFEETFTIQSGTTTITGTKTLDPEATSSTQGTCQHVSDFPVLDFFDGQGTVVEANIQTRYDAEIQAVTGTTTDQGIAFVSVNDITITGSCPVGPACEARLAGFNQTFTFSDQNPPPPPCDDDDDDPDEARDDDDDGDDECDDEDDDD
jgi:hypothetical protein